MPTEVTDPALLAQLNGEVTDPALLAQLNGPRYGSGQSFDVTNQGQVPSDSPEAQAAYSPVAGNSFLKNAVLGIGKLYTDTYLGARQIYGQATGNPLYQQAVDKRALDAPLQGTWGGKVGQLAGALPLAAIPGANTYAGAALMGGGLGALTPVTQDESRLLNTGVGAGIGVASKAAGDAISNWLTNRAAQPFLGWNQRTGNAAAAQAVGSDAPRLDQAAIAAANERFGQIFQAARNPDVEVSLERPTAQAIAEAANGLNQSSKAAFESQPEVGNLLAGLREGTLNAEQLGSISSNLGKEASGQMSSRMGDRQLGQALFSLKNHVDELIGQSITDPELKATYQAALPQYRAFSTLTSRPTILNSSTGDVNLRNLGNYLQRYDKPGYLRGGNTSDLYQAARFGQSSGLGSRPPPPILQPFKWAAYHAVNNPVVGVIGGSVSRAGAPFAPAIQTGLPALATAGVPVSLSTYFEE